MNKALKILHLEDLPTDAELVERELRKSSIEFNKVVVDNKIDFIRALKEFVPDIILSDHSLPSFNSVEALAIIKQEDVKVPFILITSTISEEFAVEVMKGGAYDYLLKDRMQRLPQAINNAMEKHRIETERHQFLEQVIANEALLKETEHLAGIGSFNSDSITGKVQWSPELYRLLGFKPGEVEPSFENLLKRVHPEDIDSVRSSLEYARLNADTLSRNFRIVMDDGSVKYISSELVFEKDKNNQPARTRGFNQDITKQKLAEEKLNKTLRELSDYKIALDESSIVSITDQKGIIRYANDNFCKISKYSREELIGHDHRIVNSGHHSKEFIRNLWITIANGKIWRGEFKNKAKDGTYYWIDATIVPFLNDQGKPYQYVAIRADITKKKEAEEILKQSEARLNKAQSIAHIGHWELNFATGIALWSKETCRIFGLDPTDNKQSFEAWKSFVHPDDKDVVMKLLDEQQESLSNTSFDHRILRNDGTVRYIHEESQFEFDSTGKPIRLYGINLDITDQKEEERIREKITAEIIQRNKDLEQFSYIISHNLRAPVANIMGLTSIVTSVPLEEKEKKTALDSLKISTEKLDSVIKDLNLILQVRQKAEEKKEKVLFSEILNDVLQSIDNLVKKENVRFNINFSEVNEMFTIKGYLHSIFYNLVSNSINYKQPTVPLVIDINSRKNNDKIILTFKDNGLGIDMAKNSSQVFGLYKRFHHDVEGKGMGLYMVKTQVETLRGKISVSSEVNKGAEFKIELESS